MKIWRLTNLIGVGVIIEALLLVACSSAANPAPITAVPTPASTATPIPTATAEPTPMPTEPATVVPPKATAIPSTLTYEETVKLFDYDQTVPLDVQEISVKDYAGVAVHDITYAAHNPQYGYPVKGRTSAYLVIPAGDGPFAGVVFMHWLGNTKSDRNEFLDEAVALAHKGVASLLIDGVFPWHDLPTSYAADQVQVINQVVELRRGLDVLLAQPGVDPQRMGYVGHDYGALLGGVLAGVDKRPKAYVLMAGMGTFSDWSLRYWPSTGDQGQDAYRAAMTIVDPRTYVKHAAPAALFFQSAEYDEFVIGAKGHQFYEAGSEPKQFQLYDASHNLDNDDARRDRTAWLASQLGFKDTK